MKPVKYIRSGTKLIEGENYFPDKFDYVVNDSYLDKKEKGEIKLNNHMENTKVVTKEQPKVVSKEVQDKHGNDNVIDVSENKENGKTVITLSDDGFYIPGVNIDEKKYEYKFENKELEQLNKEEDNKSQGTKTETHNIINKVKEDIKKGNIKKNNKGEYIDKSGKVLGNNAKDVVNNYKTEFVGTKAVNLALDYIKNNKTTNAKENEKTNNTTNNKNEYSISDNINKEIRQEFVNQLNTIFNNKLNNNKTINEKLINEITNKKMKDVYFNHIIDRINNKYGEVVDKNFVMTIGDNVIKEYLGASKSEKDLYRKQAYDFYNNNKVKDSEFNTNKYDKTIELIKSVKGFKNPADALRLKGVSLGLTDKQINEINKDLDSGNLLKVKNNLGALYSKK